MSFLILVVSNSLRPKLYGLRPTWEKVRAAARAKTEKKMSGEGSDEFDPHLDPHLDHKYAYK